MQNCPQLQEKKVFICLFLIMGKWHFCQINLMLGKCLQTALYGEMESPSSPLTNLAYTVFRDRIFHMFFRKGHVHTCFCKSGCVSCLVHVIVEQTWVFSCSRLKTASFPPTQVSRGPCAMPVLSALSLWHCCVPVYTAVSLLSWSRADFVSLEPRTVRYLAVVPYICKTDAIHTRSSMVDDKSKAGFKISLLVPICYKWIFQN